MKCDKVKELFSDHLEGVLERPMVVAFDQHLEDCPVCKREYDAFKTTWQMLDTLPEVTPPPGFAFDVTTKIRIQREAERRARPRWQNIFREVFASRVPAKVFAGAVAVFLSAQLVLHTPLRTSIAAWLVPNPTVKVTNSDPAPLPEEWASVKKAEAWLHSGLSFELEPSGSGVFKLMLKPDAVTSKDVKVYLMPSGNARFGHESVKNASLIFSGTIGEGGQVIPFVLGQSSGNQEIITALIEWKHRDQEFMEAIFVPVHLNSLGTAMTSSMRFSDTELYTALKEVSAKFGVVILANADINAKVTRVNVTNGTADDVLYMICTDIGLRWRPLGSQVYIVERKIE